MPRLLRIAPILARCSSSAARLLGMLAAALLLANCSDASLPTDVTTPPVAPPEAVIATGSTAATASVDLAGVFRFLPSLGLGAKDPSQFDPTLTDVLTVRICTVSGASCGSELAVFTSAGSGSERLRVEAADAQYIVVWGPSNGAVTGPIRIAVSIGALELGAIDVTARKGATPIKFAVDRNAVIRVRALHEAGVSATDVASALVSEFGLTDQQVAALLLGDATPYTARDASTALHRVFGHGAEKVAAVLRTVGFPVDAVAGALKDVFALAVKDVAAILKNIEPNAKEVAIGIKKAFDLGAEDAAATLKDVGYRADDVAGALKDVYGLNPKGVAAILKPIEPNPK